MRHSRYTNEDVTDVEVKINPRIHKDDIRYWTRPMRNCDDMAFTQKQFEAKAPLAVFGMLLLKIVFIFQ